MDVKDAADEESDRAGFRACGDRVWQFLCAEKSDPEIESGLEKSQLRNYGVTACGAQEFERRNAVGVQFGCVGIVVKTFSVKEDLICINHHLSQRD